MESKPSFNFKSYQSQKFSRWYVLRVIFYVIVLTIAGYVLYKQLKLSNEEVNPSLEFENLDVEIDV